MVEKIRITEKLGGSKIKKPVASEIKNIPIARKSIVAAKKIKAGDKFSLDNLTVKRPGDGICPFEIWDLIGQQSEKNYNEDENSCGFKMNKAKPSVYLLANVEITIVKKLRNF